MKHSNVYGRGEPWRVCLLTLALFFFLTGKQYAQRPSPSVGIGFQAGNPTGLSLQFYKDRGITTDILFAYDFDNFYFFNVHGLWNTHLDNRGHFHIYYGPGLFLGIRTHEPETGNDDLAAGLSGNFGLSLAVSRVEFFGQVTPRIEVTPATDFDWGGGVGIRFFF